MAKSSWRWSAVVGILIIGGGPVAWRWATTAAAEGGQWTNLGPAPLPDGPLRLANSGRVSSIAVDPRDRLHWLIGVGNGGVWETRDGGTTWAPLTDDAPTLAVGAVAFAPSDSNIIYV